MSLHVCAHCFNDPSAFKSRRRGQGKADRIFAFNLIEIGGINRSCLEPNDRFIRSRLGQRPGFEVQDLLRFSVRRIDNRVNTLAHPMASHPTANTSVGNLQSGARIALIGMAANVILATVKIVTGAVGHSYVLIADGIESALDVAGSVIIWGGLTYAARPPDATHPYGHGKAEPVAAILVSLGVIGAAVVLAARSILEIFEPHHAP